jgi:hypothetical protein
MTTAAPLVFTPTWRRISPATPLGEAPAKPAEALLRVSRVTKAGGSRVNEAARILPFRPPRPSGTPFRLRLGRDYLTDAVRGGEPCPTCQCTSWRLTPPRLWMDDRGHYWSPRRQVEKSTSDPAHAPGIETGRTA